MSTLGYMLHHHKAPADWPVPTFEDDIHSQKDVDELISEIKHQFGKEIQTAYDEWILEVVDEVYAKWLKKYTPRPMTADDSRRAVENYYKERKKS